uniref:CSON011700 protein n=1 Tax=Culicoides sonorensis TaxID=179676 RepID=A0A336LMR0_CULSO
MVEAWDVNMYQDLEVVQDRKVAKKQLMTYLIIGFTLTYFLAFLTILLFLHITPEFSIIQEWYFLFFYLNTAGGYFIFISHFVLMLKVVVIRFKLLNTAFTTKLTKKVFMTHSLDEIENVIIKISILHNEINAFIDLGNKLFSVQMIPFLAMFMNYLIFTTFQFYQVFIKYDRILLIKTVINVPWIVWSATLVLLIVHNASKILDLSQELAIKIHNTINHLDPSHYGLVIRRLKYFSQQIQHRTPIVSCGLFEIDYSLLFNVSIKMAGAFTTFVVILIQFDSSK